MFWFVFSMVVPAIAQPSGATVKTPREVAREYVDAGVVAQKNGDYDTAIDLFEKANKLSPHPVSLFNIAQVHRLAARAARVTDPVRSSHHRDVARDYYRRFLKANPAEELQVTASGWLAMLDNQWAEEYPKEEAARRADEERKREEAIRIEQERLAAERHAQERRDALERKRISAALSRERGESDRKKARILRIAGLAAVGVGLAAVATGTYFGLKARGIALELTREDVFDTARIEVGNQAERYAVISLSTGGALLLGGAVTYWIGRSVGRRSKASISVVVDVHATGMGMGVRLGGAF